LKVTKQLPRAVPPSPRYFASQAALRRWLEAHHASSRELWIGYYKKASGRPSITHQQALDEALCFGWIDGVVKRLDDERFMQRFSPRTPTSVWSVVNLKRMAELIEQGVVSPHGRKVYEERDPRRSGLYSYENRPKAFDAAVERAFRAQKDAWTFFNAQPPGYRKLCVFFVMEAKKEETRMRRLERLIAASAKGKRML
jgi:uncharacterized protein YdeI (YjbR/CyaY-like superfamily)